jgi:hypothetical protein
VHPATNASTTGTALGAGTSGAGLAAASAATGVRLGVCDRAEAERGAAGGRKCFCLALQVCVIDGVSGKNVVEERQEAWIRLECSRRQGHIDRGSNG